MKYVRLDTSLEQIVERHIHVSAPAVLATLVTTAGSTYRKSGARMLIESDGRITGLISGGCFENDLREHARQILALNESRTIEYDMRGEEDWVFGLGAGCKGAMRILLEPLAPRGDLAVSLHKAVDMSAGGQVLALAATHSGPAGELGTRVWPWEVTHPSSETLACACERAVGEGRSTGCRVGPPGAGRDVWIDVLNPPPQVLICGAGPDVESLVAALRALRFLVTVSDHRPGYVDAARFPGATVKLGAATAIAVNADLRLFHGAIVMSHHLPSDSAYLQALASTDIGYIGLLGPKARRESCLAALGSLATQLVPRLRGPVGLDIGAVTPEGIALSIAAEFHEFVARRMSVPPRVVTGSSR